MNDEIAELERELETTREEVALMQRELDDLNDRFDEEKQKEYERGKAEAIENAINALEGLQ